jgi:hypothetical protein
VCLVLLAPVPKTRAQNYNLLGPAWSAGSNVVMKLGLGPTTVALQDGSGSWNASAADALDIWNGYVDFITLSSIASATVPEISGDGVNATFFSSTIFGDTFGDDTLAVTVFLTSGANGAVMTEADVICNTAFRYDSYRGPLQTTAADIHRIFVHEFGHVLGLAHVTNTPPGQALMEPIISDLDHLAADDVAGGRHLYGAEITNLPEPVFLRQDDSFTYSPTANNSPTSYSALYLPPGITLDSATGKVGGSPTAGGVYGAVITAHGPIADAHGTISFTVAGFERVPGLVHILPVDSFRMVADPVRSRIYIGGIDGLKMINTDTFAVTTLLTGDQRWPLSVSADSANLLFVEYLNNISKLKKIDLTTLESLPSITLPIDYYNSPVLEGLDGRDYIAGQTAVRQFDAATGTLQQTFITGSERPQLAISPDRKTLAASQSDTLFTYDISGPDPVSLHVLPGSYYTPFSGSDNQFLYVINRGVADPIVRLQLPDLTSATSFGVATAGTDILVSRANAIYQTHDGGGYNSGSVLAYDATTLEQTVDLDLGGLDLFPDINDPHHAQYVPFNEVLDHSGKYLFVTIFNYGYPSDFELWVLSTDFASFPPAPPPLPTKNLLNISTRVRVESGENATIGGFIVQGVAPKKVLVRGLGPSLPITGALSDPVLELHDSTGQLIASNNDWKSDELSILSSAVPPVSERESAILMTLDPGAYTAIVRDATSQPGLSLVEVYDLDAGNSSVANISTRGKVGTGDNVMIGGFIIGGEDLTRVVIRAIGPSLGTQGVALPLVDPVLEIHDSTGKLISTNDNWRSTQQNEIVATGIAPTNDSESAILLTLDPGSYTAIVRGQNNTTGVALVEVYNLDSASAPSK